MSYSGRNLGLHDFSAPFVIFDVFEQKSLKKPSEKAKKKAYKTRHFWGGPEMRGIPRSVALLATYKLTLETLPPPGGMGRGAGGGVAGWLAGWPGLACWAGGLGWAAWLLGMKGMDLM